MTNSTKKKAPAKRAPRKKPVAEAVESAVKEDAKARGRAAPAAVAPMHPDAYRLAMTIVNNADIKGGDAETILLLKRELARVAGQITGEPRS